MDDDFSLYFPEGSLNDPSSMAKLDDYSISSLSSPFTPISPIAGNPNMNGNTIPADAILFPEFPTAATSTPPMPTTSPPSIHASPSRSSVGGPLRSSPSQRQQQQMTSPMLQKHKSSSSSSGITAATSTSSPRLISPSALSSTTSSTTPSTTSSVYSHPNNMASPPAQSRSHAKKASMSSMVNFSPSTASSSPSSFASPTYHQSNSQQQAQQQQQQQQQPQRSNMPQRSTTANSSFSSTSSSSNISNSSINIADMGSPPQSQSRLSLSHALKALNTLHIFLQDHHASQQQIALSAHGSGPEGARKFWDSQKHPLALGTTDQYAAIQDLRKRIITLLQSKEFDSNASTASSNAPPPSFQNMPFSNSPVAYDNSANSSSAGRLPSSQSAATLHSHPSQHYQQQHHHYHNQAGHATSSSSSAAIHRTRSISMDYPTTSMNHAPVDTSMDVDSNSNHQISSGNHPNYQHYHHQSAQPRAQHPASSTPSRTDRQAYAHYQQQQQQQSQQQFLSRSQRIDTCSHAEILSPPSNNMNLGSNPQSYGHHPSNSASSRVAYSQSNGHLVQKQLRSVDY